MGRLNRAQRRLFGGPSLLAAAPLLAALAAGCGGAAGAEGAADAGGAEGGLGEGGIGEGGGIEAGPDAPIDDCVFTGRPFIDPDSLEDCSFCVGGACVGTDALPAGQRDQFADCDATRKCVPDLFLHTNGSFLLPSCRSTADTEGRCLSRCLPQVQALEGILPRASCAETDLCVPCFDPITGADTGVCSLACDPGPTEPAFTYGRCCSDRGACVPAESIPAEGRARLGADVCAEPALCVPDALAGSGITPTSCRSTADAEGRCLPECLPGVAALGDRLPVDICEPGSRCVPCFDPLTGEPTGACESGTDVPVDPPLIFERCCMDRGACIPESLVDPAERASLDQDVCTSSTDLCVPDAITDPTYTPPSCASILGAEGRCLSTCLPGVASRADTLPVDSCTPGNLCVPCYEPVTGAGTGACELGDDMPTQPPVLFTDCCLLDAIPRGSCVPTELVPEGSASRLEADTCEVGSVCLPDALLLDPAYVFPSCDTMGPPLGPGACLPDCMLGRFADLVLRQQSCAPGEACVPCELPLLGPTGACL